MGAMASAGFFVYDIHRCGPGCGEMEPLEARPRGGLVMGVVHLRIDGRAEDPPDYYPILFSSKRLLDCRRWCRSRIQAVQAGAGWLAFDNTAGILPRFRSADGIAQRFAKPVKAMP